MSNRQIYIDVDDVISDTTITFPSLLKQYFGKTISFEAITSFDLGKSFDLDKTELDRFMNIAHSSEVILAYQPRTGAVESIQSLISLGYEISIVTGRPFSSKGLTQQWLAKHSIPYHHLLFVDKYSRSFTGADETTALSLEEFSQLDFCFAVEDSGYMAGFLSQHMKIPVALLDRPWNRSHRVEGMASSLLVKRCFSWDEVMDTFLLNKHADNNQT